MAVLPEGLEAGNGGILLVASDATCLAAPIRNQFFCGGSTEKPAYGVGSSEGGGQQEKVVSVLPNNPFSGKATICQDVPNIFSGIGGPACVQDVEIFIR